MNIIIDNYTLEPEPNATDKFNIRKVQLVDQKFKNAKNKTRTYIFAYGLTLERAVDLIVKDKCADTKGDVTLMEYIKTYQSIYNQFWTNIKKHLNIK